MKQLEQRYVKERINSIKNKKLEQVDKKYIVKPVRLNSKEKYNLMKKGKVKANLITAVAKINVNSWSNSVYFPSLDDIYDFTKYESDSKDMPIRQKLIDEIIDEADRITDKLILGDASDALKAITKFALMKI